MRLLILPVLLAFFLHSEGPGLENGDEKILSGTFRHDTGLFDAEKGSTCRMDSAAGAVLYLESEHENPLFASKAPNKVHLILWWKTPPETGVRYQLPHPEIEVCYWEQGDLLMFHTFSAQGTVTIAKIKEGKYLSGNIDMKLVNPHHNFSNSDFHYLGGNFKAGLK